MDIYTMVFSGISVVLILFALVHAAFALKSSDQMIDDLSELFNS